MKEDNSIIRLRQPGSVEDPLTEIAREGARRMLVTALEAEIEAFLEGFVEERLADGRQRVVRWPAPIWWPGSDLMHGRLRGHG